MSRFALLFVAPLIFASVAEARTWKNQAGKEIEAEFVSADATTVTLKMASGDNVTFKLELLSAADQEFVREQLRVKAAFGEDNEKKEKTAKAESKKGPSLDSRVWTDLNGKKITARFVSISAGVLTLKMGTSKTIMVPLASLSDADKKYVAEALEARGEALDHTPDPSTIAQGSNTPAPGAFPAMPAAPVMPAMPVIPNRPARPRDPTGFLEVKSLDNYVGIALDDGRVVTRAMIDELPAAAQSHLLTFSNFPERSRRTQINNAFADVVRDAERKQREELANAEREQREGLDRIRREQMQAEAKLRDDERAARLAAAPTPTYTPTPTYSPAPTPAPSYTPPAVASAPIQRTPRSTFSSVHSSVPQSHPRDDDSSGGSGRIRIPLKAIYVLVVLVIGFFGWIGRQLTGGGE